MTKTKEVLQATVKGGALHDAVTMPAWPAPLPRYPPVHYRPVHNALLRGDKRLQAMPIAPSRTEFSSICLSHLILWPAFENRRQANQTALDIPPAFRNDVLRSKRVIVGCGGGFHQNLLQWHHHRYG